MRPNFSFSPDDFKKWMEKNGQEEKKQVKINSLIGLAVESKISFKRLAVHIKPKDGDPHELLASFKENGGIIYDVDGKNFLIEVDSGYFYVPRYFVKKLKEN